MVTLKDIENLGYKKVGKTRKSRVGQCVLSEQVPEEVKAKSKGLKWKVRVFKADDGSEWKANADRDGRVIYFRYWTCTVRAYEKGIIKLNCLVLDKNEFISNIFAKCNGKSEPIKCGENATIEQVERQIEDWEDSYEDAKYEEWRDSKLWEDE